MIGTTTIIIIVLVLLGLSVGGYFLFRQTGSGYTVRTSCHQITPKHQLCDTADSGTPLVPLQSPRYKRSMKDEIFGGKQCSTSCFDQRWPSTNCYIVDSGQSQHYPLCPSEYGPTFQVSMNANGPCQTTPCKDISSPNCFPGLSFFPQC